MFTRAIVALLLLCGVAQAQTTTFGAGGFPCNAAITVSGGGLTLTSSAAAGNKFCVANVGKYIKDVYTSGAGLFYYTFTPGSAITAQIYGFAAGPSVPNGLGASSTTALGEDFASMGYSAASGNIRWFANTLVSGVGGGSNGATGAVVVNLNTDAAEVWVTPNIATLSCNGSGSTGTTRPKWNGSCAFDPSLPGTGIPSAGSGAGAVVYMQGAQFFPAVTLGASDATTLSFADNGTLDTYLPAGYVAWNDSSGSSCTFPCPLDTVTLNVANAPKYTNSATITQGNASTHTLASRIIAGPGCTKTTWTVGASCWLWQATTAGTTSASGDPTGGWSCASPAATGGIYATSFPGASTQTDNGVIFACLVAIDYISIGYANQDTGIAWAAGTGSCPTTGVQGPGCYYEGTIVKNAGNYYVNLIQIFSPPYVCVSAGVAPTGTGSTVDGTCHWFFAGAILYASGSTPYWPQSINPRGTGNITEMAYAHNTTVMLWDGGHEQPQYQSGAGEGNPIPFGPHQGPVAEANAYCLHGYNSVGIGAPGCNGSYMVEHLTVAPGDSFVDNTKAADPLQPSNTYGVMLYNDASFDISSHLGVTLQENDTGFSTDRIQVKSVHGIAINGAWGTFSSNVNFNNIIAEAGGPLVLAGDAVVAVSNSLLMLDSIAPAGSIAVYDKYTSIFSYNTIVCAPGITNSVAIGFAGVNPLNSFTTPIQWVGNAYFGCTHPWAYTAGGGWDTFPFSNQANATDIASSYTGTTITTSTGQTLTTAKIAGTSLYNLSISNELANPTFGSSFNARIKSTSSSLYGNGVNYSYNSGQNGLLYPNNGVFIPGPDILGITRPISGRYDIGAVMLSGSSPTPPSAGIGGGRSFFH